MRNLFSKFFRGLYKSRVKILSCITILTVVLSIFLIPASADSVNPGASDSTVVYSAYPPLDYFSPYLMDSSGITPGITYGRTAIASDYIVGLYDDINNALLDSDFSHRWNDKFSFYAYLYNEEDYGFKEYSIRNTHVLSAFNGTFGGLGYGKAVRWQNLFDSRDVESYFYTPSYVFKYSGFVATKQTLQELQPVVTLRFDSDTLEAGAEVDYTVQWIVKYNALNYVDKTVSTGTLNYSYTDEEYRNATVGGYTAFQLLPTTQLVNIMDLRRYDSIYIDECYFYLVADGNNYNVTNMNVTNYLVPNSSVTALGIDVPTYMNQANEWMENNDPFDIDFIDWLSTAVGSFLEFELVPGISFQVLLQVCMGISLFFVTLKFFAGG